MSGEYLQPVLMSGEYLQPQTLPFCYRVVCCAGRKVGSRQGNSRGFFGLCKALARVSEF